MGKIGIVIHGGAGPDSEFIKKNIEEYRKGLKEAAQTGYKVLEEGGNAIDAVEAAVNYLEENPLFNAGRGSALNNKAEVEMDASVMNGKDLKAGAVCIVKNVKNPVTLARAVMDKSKHLFLGGNGALEFAQQNGLRIMPDAYFITDHAFEQYQSAVKEEGKNMEEAGAWQVNKRSHGTVGAVAVDTNGNVASATSTGGTENKLYGRIGDTSMIGTGTYANNKTCAVSCTGDGEYIIQNVVAFHVSALMTYKGLSLKEATNFLMNEELKDTEGDIGFIAIDPAGNIAMEYNSERMHRAWKTSDGEEGCATYNK